MQVVPDPAGKYGDVLEYKLDGDPNYSEETRVEMGLHAPPIFPPFSVRMPFRFTADYNTRGNGWMNIISIGNQTPNTANIYGGSVRGDMKIVTIDRKFATIDGHPSGVGRHISSKTKC